MRERERRRHAFRNTGGKEVSLLASVGAAVLIAGANYADHATTESAIARGGVERGLRGPAIRMGVAAGEYAVFHAIRKESKTAGWIYVGVVVGVNAVIAHHNHNVLRR